ncbi:MAG: TRAP transporter large permease [Burkholderiales bacterium]
MSSVAVGIAGLALILVLVLLRMPVAVALAVVGLGGITYLAGAATTFSFVSALPYDFAASWELSTVPTFLLMGSLLYRSGMTDSIFQALRLWVGALPGGLAVASNFTAAVFAAACGSSVATTVAVGRIAIPEMLKSKYDRGLATAVCACSGTLGSMIPPSVMMIIYCAFTSQSIAAVFAAGILPGILTAVVYAIMIITRCALHPTLAPRPKLELDPAEKWRALKRAWPIPTLIVIVIGSIYGQIATPTEAGAVGALGAAAIAASNGRLSLAVVRESAFEALQGTAAILFVAVGAVFVTRFLALSGLPDLVTAFVKESQGGVIGLLLFAIVVYLILGCFMEPVGIMLLTLPIFVAPLEALSANLIWFGILMVKLLEIGLITPPVGLNVFAAKALVRDDVSLREIFAGCGWFLVCEAVVLSLLIAFQDISLSLPRALGLM